MAKRKHEQCETKELEGQKDAKHACIEDSSSNENSHAASNDSIQADNDPVEEQKEASSSNASAADVTKMSPASCAVFVTAAAEGSDSAVLEAIDQAKLASRRGYNTRKLIRAMQSNTPHLERLQAVRALLEVRDGKEPFLDMSIIIEGKVRSGGQRAGINFRSSKRSHIQ